MHLPWCRNSSSFFDNWFHFWTLNFTLETDCKAKDRLDNCVHWFPELVEQSVKQVRRALLHLCTAKRITSILTANKFISFSQVLLEWLSSYTKTSFTFPRVFILSPSTPRTPLLCSCAKNCRQNLANYLLKKKNHLNSQLLSGKLQTGITLFWTWPQLHRTQNYFPGI